MKKLGLIAIVAMLAACGGGGGSSTTATTTDATTTASAATATALGATLIPTSSPTATAYRVVADIGDSWSFTFDSAITTYKVEVDSTQYSVASTSGLYVSNVNGNFITYTLTGAGTASGTLIVDNRTKSITGNVVVGGKSTTVSGTGYQISDLSKLAGTYFFAYATRNQSNGGSTDTGEGQMVINSAGTSATLCSGGTVNASNTCTPFAAGVTTELNAATLELKNGAVIVKIGGVEWGRLQVHAGDFGASLIVDRYGLNGNNIMRVGTLYAAKAQTLKGTEFDGNWSCSQLGKSDSTATVSSTSATVKDATTPNATGTAAYTITYNQMIDLYNNQTIAFNGVANMKTTAAGFTSVVHMLPLSSSLTITSNAYGGLNVCRKTS